jgi:nicotinamidase-related amidase
MSARILIIDPQNDFCDIPGAALPVAGASDDMQRLGKFIHDAGTAITDIVVTLDSHPSVAIERTTFWQTSSGGAVAPFTEVTEADVRQGYYRPRDETLTAQVLAYLSSLEAGGKYRLMIWPVHCVVGTWGHNIHEAVAVELAAWEFRSQSGALKVLKGFNPMTEQYSAVRAEVPRDDDETTQTRQVLVDRVASGDGFLLVAGEASSHCVAATMEDLFPYLSPEQLHRTILLRDCMSPVSGFQKAEQEFFDRAGALGARVMTSADAAELLGHQSAE